MKNLNQSRLVAVFARENLESLISKGYCGYWKTNIVHANSATYLLVVHNKNNNTKIDNTLSHGEGFFLAEINKVTKRVFDKKGKNNDDKKIEKKIFHFQKYAKISNKKTWSKLTKGRQPITYKNTQDAFDLLGLDFDSLVWETLPPKDELSENLIQNNTEQSETIQAEILPLPVAVAHAKALITKHTGIDESAIHISFDDF